MSKVSKGSDTFVLLVNRLATLEELTAGDFANVCRQRDLLGGRAYGGKLCAALGAGVSVENGCGMRR